MKRKIESLIAEDKNHQKKQIVRDTPIIWTALSIKSQAAAEICNIYNLLKPGIWYNHKQ